MRFLPFRNRSQPPAPPPVQWDDLTLPDWKRAFRDRTAAIGPAGPLFDPDSAVAFLEAVADSVAPRLRDIDCDPSPGAAELHAIQRAARLVQAAHSLATSEASNRTDLPVFNVHEGAEAWVGDGVEASVIARAMLEHLGTLSPVEVREELANLLARALLPPPGDN